MTQNSAKPRIGEYWRWIAEGKVEMVTGVDVKLRREGERHTWGMLEAGTWERLPDTEPEWKAGELVLDACGQIFQRMTSVNPNPDTALVWLWVNRDSPCGDGQPTRPLRRLVIEGQ